ncbi:hypothetical protein GCM10027037_24110 [Mucilaginibacter koreensis]
MNPTVQSLWIGSQLSNVERLCIKSFLDHGHPFHLYAYEEIKNPPAGTTIIDARTILPESAIFRYKEGWGAGSVSGFADIFRLQMIKKTGGWWVDMDIICLKPLDFEQELIFCSSYESEYGSLVNNCIFRAPQNSRFITYCLDEIDKIDLQNMSFGLAGPFLFQQGVKALQLEGAVMPFDYFNPIGWRNVNEMILGNANFKSRFKESLRPILKPATLTGRRITKNSYTLHLWNEIWKSSNFDKNGRYSSSSLFEKLKRKHGID